MPFKLKHLLAITAIGGSILAAVIALLTPFIILFSKISVDQHRIIHQFDHSLIRNAATTLLNNGAEGPVEPSDWPAVIAETEPKQVFQLRGAIYIEYGSGFAHYGLVVDPSNEQPRENTKLINDVYFYETE